MQIIFLSFWHPYPADNGAKIRVMALLRALAREHRVDLVVLGTEPGDVGDPGPLAEICRSVTTIAVPSFSPRSGLNWRDLFRMTPRSLIATYDPTVTTLLERRFAAGECNAVICGDLAAYYGLIAARRLPVFVDELDPSRFLDAIRDAATTRRRIRARLTWWKHRRFMRRLLDACMGCFVASEREAALLRTIAPHAEHIALVRNGVTLTKLSDTPRGDARRLVYSGSPTYAPNRDAVAFFAADILPRIRARMPDAWLAVTGKTDGIPLGSLATTPGVTFTNWLPDIRAYVAASRVCVVPLRQGGGTRLKILEAMALGTPVVATTKGAEGLDLTNGEDILIADDPAAFADATVRLLTDDALHARIAARARATAAARYDWEMIGTELLAALERLTNAHAAPAQAGISSRIPPQTRKQHGRSATKLSRSPSREA